MAVQNIAQQGAASVPVSSLATRPLQRHAPDQGNGLMAPERDPQHTKVQPRVGFASRASAAP